MTYKPVGSQEYNLDILFLDLNGTIVVNGRLVDGVKERINTLKQSGFTVILLSGDINGTGKSFADELEIDFIKAVTTEEKASAVMAYPKEKIVAIGNARIDIGMFRNAGVSIATLQEEGIHAEILQTADVIVSSINDALDLLINRRVFEGTMRL